MTMPFLYLDHMNMDFPTPNGPFRALEQVDMAIDEGEFISIIGHSGCGKSTVLNIIAGLLQATEGGVVLEGKEVAKPGPERAVIFQNHSLLPWMTAYENIELACNQVFTMPAWRLTGLSEAEKNKMVHKQKKSQKQMREWIEYNLALVHMDHAMDKRPDEISGGMKQRVGIARALAMQPKVLLMDEPFGALDALTRAHMQESLMEIQNELKNTVVMITHDVDEAVLLSDKIVMMTNGPAASIGEILHIELERPRDRIALAEDAKFNSYRHAVLEFLYARQRNPAQLAEEKNNKKEDEGEPSTEEPETETGTAILPDGMVVTEKPGLRLIG